MFDKYLSINDNKIKIFKPPFEVFGTSWNIMTKNIKTVILLVVLVNVYGLKVEKQNLTNLFL